MTEQAEIITVSAQTTTQLCDMLANLLDQSRDREEALEEEVLRLEALVRAKDETIGELLELIPDGLGEGTWTRIDHLAAEDWRQYHEDIRLGRFS